ncbi:MAG: CBS domain-containing protein [Kiritimatiellia bacterium]|jgi:CBS domain-containing protein
MRVSDLMSTELITLHASSPLISASEIMNLGRIRHLPCTEDGRFVGLVTHRDLMLAYLPKGTFAERSVHAATLKVEQIMQRDVATVKPDADIADVARALYEHKYGCLPVVDDAGALLGIVTESDFLRLTEVAIAVLRKAELVPELQKALKNTTS